MALVPAGQGPVVDDQGDADEGEQQPETKEEGGLQRQEGTSYLQQSPQTPGKKQRCFPLLLCPLVFGVHHDHC